MKVNSGLGNQYVNALLTNTSGHLFAGTNSGVFRTTDNGNNWIDMGLTGKFIQRLAISASGIIFAGATSGIYRSTDNGISWTQTSLINTSIGAIAINSLGHVFAGTRDGGGILRSTDNGNNWTQINNGLNHLNIFSLQINSNGYIFAGTIGGGVYSSINSTTDINETEDLPAEFALYQNYPNPFNPETVIRYQLPVSSKVTLGIYDIVGKEVRKLVNDEQEAGSHTVKFNAGNLSSGVYICRITAGDFVKTIKMSLVK